MNQLQPYPEYKDSGIEWVGRIPVGWDTHPLFAAVQENTASNKAGGDSNLLSLSYGRIIRKDIAANDGLLPASFDTYQVINRNDIVLRLTDLQNDKRSLRSAISPERGIITSAYLAVTPTNILPHYLSYLLRAYDLQKVFYAMGGGLRQSMKFSDMKWLPILLPPESTQREIIAYLDRETAQIDELIGKQERLIELLAEKRQAVITHAVTKGLNPTAPTKPSGIPWLGDIPAHWVSARFSRILLGIKDGTHGTHTRVDVGMPLLGSTNVRAGYLERFEDESQISQEDHQSIVANGYPRRGDVLLAIIGASIGRSCVYELNEPLAFQRSVAFLRFNRAVDPRFMQLFMESDFYQQQLWNNVKSSAQGGVYLGVLSSLNALVPPLDEQHTIVATLTDSLTRISTITSIAEKSVRLLNERRSALISAAVTGKIDVTNEGVAS